MWYICEPASSASRLAMSAMVVPRKTPRSASAPRPRSAGLAGLAHLAVERLDHLEHGDPVRDQRANIAFDAPLTLQQPVASQGRKAVRGTARGCPGARPPGRSVPAGRRTAQLGQSDDAVARFRGHRDHGEPVVANSAPSRGTAGPGPGEKIHAVSEQHSAPSAATRRMRPLARGGAVDRSGRRRATPHLGQGTPSGRVE